LEDLVNFWKTCWTWKARQAARWFRRRWFRSTRDRPPDPCLLRALCASGFRFCGLEYRLKVCCVGFEVWELGSRVYGVWFRVSSSRRRVEVWVEGSC